MYIHTYIHTHTQTYEYIHTHTKLQTEVSNLRGLKTLNLSGNLALEILPTSVGTMTNLEVLDVDRYVCVYVCMCAWNSSYVCWHNDEFRSTGCRQVCMCVCMYVCVLEILSMSVGIMTNLEVLDVDRYVCMYVCMYVCLSLFLRMRFV